MAERHATALKTPFAVELRGMRLIEAGAGTGKTWTLAALVLRLLLEWRCEIGQILVVTYTRAASGELRGRIRARLAEALAAFDAGSSEDDYLQALIARHPAAEAKVRLRLAMESFDEAAIFTIHGFCQRALGEAAFVAGQPFERELIADQNELLAEVARNAWRRMMATASPLWAQYLIKTLKGPEGLVARIENHLGRTAAQVMAPAPVDRQAAERKLLAAWQQARALWQAEGDAVHDWLANARLKRNIYTAAKIDAAVTAASTWFAEDTPLLPLPEALGLLGQKKIAQGRTKDGPSVELAFFTAMDALIQAVEDFTAACDTALRGFVAEFRATAQAQLAVAKQQRGLQSYDDLLADLAAALDGPAGHRLIDSLRARYRVALVDEFQDTDALQLAIFTRLFGSQTHPLIFVGDPKQAIYGFRGADVFAYLAARARADAIHALLENRRSTRPLLDALNALFERPRPFLLDDLPYEPAQAAKAQAGRPPCLIEDEMAPLTLWVMEKPAKEKSFSKEAGRRMAAEAVANDIARLLGLAAAGRARLGDRPLCGGDFAVLVRKHYEGDLVREALQRLGIPSVSSSGGSVWASEEAEELERLLLAVAQPTREGLVRAALATVLLGADAAQLAAWRDDELSWSERLERFHDDQRLLRERGFMAMWRRLLRREEVVARILARPDGERRMTNYRHLAELLQVAEQQAALDAEGLARYIADQRVTSENEDSQLRLESDAHLVRIVTQHAAKGLQYPIVYCPFLWLGPEEKHDWPVLAHLDGAALLDFGSPEAQALARAADREAAAEELRLAYVALTRAEHRCVVIWGKVNNCARSPLAWLLFGPRRETVEDPHAWLAQWLDAHDEIEHLRVLENGLDGALKVLPLPWQGAAPILQEAAPVVLQPRRFAGHIPAPWQVRSFSSLAARLAEEAEGADHDAIGPRGAVPPAPSFDSILDFPRGTRAGSCLHALFERIDFQRHETIAPAVAAVLAEYGYAQQWQPALERLAADVLATPLNAAGLKLADIPSQDRIVEMGFTFPWDSSAGRAGYMKGYIDLVFRAEGRWYIVDWKSNWLEDYGPASLAEAMRLHRYDLQLNIYAAALKRALAWREPAGDWEAAFGGVFYLFLRGMKPGRSQGVYFARPTAADIDGFLDEVGR